MREKERGKTGEKKQEGGERRMKERERKERRGEERRGEERGEKGRK